MPLWSSLATEDHLAKVLAKIVEIQNEDDGERVYWIFG